MVPVLDKDAVKFLTQNIDKVQAEYVAGVSSVYQDIVNNYPEISEKNSGKEDVLFVTKIMAFADKFKTLHWAADNHSYHAVLDEFGEELESFKDEIAENIQSIIGQFEPTDFVKLELPVGDNPLDIINELKICLVDWMELHKDDMEYEGCRNELSGFIQIVHKYIYLFRLCK